jgi:hypothetical protein
MGGYNIGNDRSDVQKDYICNVLIKSEFQI